MRKEQRIDAEIAAGGPASLHGSVRGVRDARVRPAHAFRPRDLDASASGGAAARQTGFTLFEVTLASFLAAGIFIGFMIMLNQQAGNERDRASARTFQQAVDAAYVFFSEPIPLGTANLPAVRAAAPVDTSLDAELREEWPQTRDQLDRLVPSLEFDDMLMGNGNPLMLAVVNLPDASDLTDPAADPPHTIVPPPPAPAGVVVQQGGFGLDAAEAARRAGFFNIWAAMDDMGEAQRVRALLGGGAVVLDNPPRVLLSAAVPGAAAATRRFLLRNCRAGDPRCVITGQMTFDPDAVLAMRGTLDLDGAPGRRARLNVGAEADVAFDVGSRVTGTMTFDPDAAMNFNAPPGVPPGPAIDFGERRLDNAGDVLAISVDAADRVETDTVETGGLEFDVP